MRTSLFTAGAVAIAAALTLAGPAHVFRPSRLRITVGQRLRRADGARSHQSRQHRVGSAARLGVGQARRFDLARAVALGHAEPLHLGGVQLQILRVQQPRRQNRRPPTQRNAFVLLADQHAPCAIGFGFGNFQRFTALAAHCPTASSPSVALPTTATGTPPVGPIENCTVTAPSRVGSRISPWL